MKQIVAFPLAITGNVASVTEDQRVICNSEQYKTIWLSEVSRKIRDKVKEELNHSSSCICQLTYIGWKNGIFISQKNLGQ